MKLLDEKGLTTVWAAIKNTFLAKSAASSLAKTADVNTALAKKVDAVSGKGLSTNDFTAAYKSKLDGIATGANNYTLPTASNTTLGGIKVSINKPGTEWPICVDNNGLAYTAILGLAKDDNNGILSINLGDSYANTSYGTSSIEVSPLESENSIELTYPTTSGTFALTSDIPDVSSLCKFNSANSIEDCVYGRINFMCPFDTEINLDSIRNKEGIIIFAYLQDQSNITCSNGFLYNEDSVDQKVVGAGTFLITCSAGVLVVLSL